MASDKDSVTHCKSLSLIGRFLYINFLFFLSITGPSGAGTSRRGGCALHVMPPLGQLAKRLSVSALTSRTGLSIIRRY